MPAIAQAPNSSGPARRRPRRAPRGGVICGTGCWPARAAPGPGRRPGASRHGPATGRPGRRGHASSVDAVRQASTRSSSSNWRPSPARASTSPSVYSNSRSSGPSRTCSTTGSGSRPNGGAGWRGSSSLRPVGWTSNGGGCPQLASRSQPWGPNSTRTTVTKSSSPSSALTRRSSAATRPRRRLRRRRSRKAAQDHRGQLDRRQALAADIAHDQPQPAGRERGVVEAPPISASSAADR